MSHLKIYNTPNSEELLRLAYTLDPIKTKYYDVRTVLSYSEWAILHGYWHSREFRENSGVDISKRKNTKNRNYEINKHPLPIHNPRIISKNSVLPNF